MPYQSFFAGKQAPAAPTGGGYTSYFGTPTIQQPTPQQLTIIRAQAAARNPNNLKDVPSLNKALSAGYINKAQWVQQFQKIAGTNKPSGPTSFSILHPSTYGAVKAYGPSVINEQDIQPVKNTFVGAYQQAMNQAKYLSGPTPTQQQRNSVINNQKAANTNTEFQKAVKGLNLTGNSASGRIQAQKMAANGAKASDIRSFLQKDSKALSAQTGRGVTAATTIASFSVPGEGIVAKSGMALAKKTGLSDALATARAGVGRDTATNTLINSQKIATASKAATVADKLGGNAVKEAKTTRIPVVSPTETAGARKAVGSVAISNADRSSIPVKMRTSVAEGVGVHTPVHPGIKQVSTTTKIGVRTPVQMSGQDFNREFSKLNKAYEQDTRALEAKASTTHPDILQAKQQAIETAHQNNLAQLLDKYNNPELSKPTAPKLVTSKTTPAGKTTGGLQKPAKVPKQPRTLASSLGNARKPTIGEVPVPPSAFDNHIAPSTTGEPAAFTPRTVPIKVDTAKVTTPTAKPPKTPSVSAADSTGLKPSGSAIRTQAAAVEKGMKEEEALTGATFRGVSHKEQAVKAANLVNEDPQKAMDIAMGRARGDNVSHEAAVYHAVKNAEIERALKTGDWSTVQDLANSGRHTAVSEHAQALGAEGYNTNPHDPVAIMNDLANTRAKTLGKNTTSTVVKEAKNVEIAVKAATPKVSKMDWHTFVESIKC